jgi:hypothetical protein
MIIPKKLPASRGARTVAAAAVLAVLAAPIAFAAGEGDPIKLGKRNPTRSAVAKETQVIANSAVNTYGTRQSNLGAGGGAIYGCRSVIGADLANPAVSTPCVRVNNLSTGEAFQFVGLSGTTIGLIQAGPVFATPNPNARPFVTNATGVATGLNADKLDGRDAEQIIAEARVTNPAGSAPSFAFARVGADGKTDASRTQGVADTNIKKTTVGVYCFYGLSSRPKNAQATLDGVPGEIATDTTSNTDAACPDPNVELIVRTYDSAGAPADKGFQLAVTGGGA